MRDAHRYAGVLGFRLVARSEDQLELDTGALRLFVNRDAEALRTYIPSLDVPDHAAARRHLEAAGCKTVAAGTYSEAVYFQDPFGFVFDIIERPSMTMRDCAAGKLSKSWRLRKFDRGRAA